MDEISIRDTNRAYRALPDRLCNCIGITVVAERTGRSPEYTRDLLEACPHAVPVQGELVRGLHRYNYWYRIDHYDAIESYVARHGIVLPNADAIRLGMALSRFCRQEGIRIARVPSRTWRQVNAYRIDVLDDWRAQRMMKPTRLTIEDMVEGLEAASCRI